jgi:hypothetical protein
MLRVCGRRKTEADAQIRPYTNNEYPLTNLGNAEIGGIQQLEHDVITKSFVAATGMELLKTRKVMQPVFVASGRNIGKAKSVDYVAIVVREALAKEAFDVLKHERKWLNLTHGTHCLRKHIPVIFTAEVLSTQRKRLTWRSAANQECRVSVRTKVIPANVTLDDFPISNVRDSE